MHIVLTSDTGNVVYHERDIPEIRLLSRAPDIINWRGMVFVLTPQNCDKEIIYREADKLTLSDDLW